MHLFKQKISVKKKGQRLIIKITGALVYMLLELDTDKFKGCVVYEKGRNVLYVVVLRAIHGILVASLLWCQKLKKYLKSIEFVLNNYNPCVSNSKVNGKHNTVRFHVDDILSTNANQKVKNKSLKWLNKNYSKFKNLL